MMMHYFSLSYIHIYKHNQDFSNIYIGISYVIKVLVFTGQDIFEKLK